MLFEFKCILFKYQLHRAAKTENLPNRNAYSGRLLRRLQLHVCAANESTSDNHANFMLCEYTWILFKYQLHKKPYS